MLELGKLSHLRVLVACLGEQSDPPWWRSGFTGDAGLDFARYNFVRSHASAAVSGAVVAARHVHDERIGRTGVRHLFRLDAGLERAVHREILEADQDELRVLIADPFAVADALRAFATQTVVAPEGPVQIGRLGEEEHEEAVVDLAAHYLSGFTTGRIVLPYFASVRK